jgi:GrpB-like predicted nucleotidyltransferase (UPF0157 family)
LELHQKLTAGLKASGFVCEEKKYSPHIMLGREIITKAQPRQTKPFGETVSQIDLMKSERVGGKLTYTSIYRRGKKKSPIIVEPYNTEWASEFEKIRQYLLPHIRDLIVDIHHVGSTSVEGLSAKPIIDFDIEITSMAVFSQLKERLSRLGFHHEGDYGISGREVFRRMTPDDFMQYHMYVCPSESEELMQHLRFRDALRTNPQAVNEYGMLKIALATKHVNDIDAYIKGKTSFVRNILAAGNVNKS